jgi:uncharacterized protein (DUF1778 family)
MTEVKMDRLQLRIDEASKRHLEEAAKAAHLTVTSFVLQAAQQRADHVLADRALISLSAEAAEDFVVALDELPKVNPHLLQALQRPRKVDWLD